MKKNFGILLWLLIAAPLAVPGCGGRNKFRPSHNKDAEKKDSASLSTMMDVLGSTKRDSMDSGIIAQAPSDNEPLKNESATPATTDTASRGTTEQKTADQGSTTKKTELVGAMPFLEGDETIEFNFENADLEQLVNQISSLFNVTFISDDAIAPASQGAKLVKGNKISFKTHHPLSRKEAWNFFITFLDLAGLAIVQEANPRFMRITSIDHARKSALQSYIGVPHDTLPDNDQIIRYVYFIENTAVETIKSIVDSLRSTASSLTVLQELKAFILTDKAYNIKSLMNIIKELDQVSMPQAMSVLKLRRVDATEVKKLYDSLMGTDEKSAAAARLFPQLRKQPNSQYFPENTRIIPEPRTNSLILLGPIDAIRRIESFVTEHIDTPLDQPYSPLFVLPLRYADATTIANIMNEVSQFGKNTEAGKTGGVRGGDKYMRPILFTPEPETNRLVIKGDYEDYLRAKEIINQLDAPQPQVAVEVLLLSLTASSLKQLGAVLRSRQPGTGTQLFGSQVKFQTTGLFNGTTQQGVVENDTGAGVLRLLGNLLNLVNFATPGSSVVSLGDALSVWGIVAALESVTTAQILANPFLVATNKTKAQVVLGEIYRATMGTVIGTAPQNVYGDIPARLEVHVTPQINSDGMIIMDLEILLQQFVGAANPNNIVRTEQKITTKTILADKEVLALGGMIQTEADNTMSKVPILGDIPIIGWLFKNRSQQDTKENLLILISAHIMKPDKEEALRSFTSDRSNEYRDTMEQMNVGLSGLRDPIDRWFFRTRQKDDVTNMQEFIFRNETNAQQENNEQKPTPVSTITMDTPAPTAKPEISVVQRTKKSLVQMIEQPPAGGAPCS
jgi:general secretion pathway protein D